MPAGCGHSGVNTQIHDVKMCDAQGEREMTLSVFLESLDGLDESLSNLYVKDDENGYRLDADYAAAGLENVSNLKSALARVKSERLELKDKVSLLEKYEPLLEVDDFDPSDVRELMARASEGGNEELERLENRHKKELEKLKDALSESQLLAKNAVADKSSYIIRSELTSAAIDADVVKEGIDDTVLLTMPRAALDDNGKVQILDEDGDPIGKTPKEYFSTDYKAIRPHLFKTQGVGGSGAGQGAGTTNAGSVKSFADAKTVKDKVAAIGAKLNK